MAKKEIVTRRMIYKTSSPMGRTTVDEICLGTILGVLKQITLKALVARLKCYIVGGGGRQSSMARFSKNDSGSVPKATIKW